VCAQKKTRKREIEIEVYCEERKVHSKVRMTIILEKLEMSKVKTILRRESILYALLVTILTSSVN
jgi:hypothetical protein